MKKLILHLMDFITGLVFGSEAYERNKRITDKLIK